MTFEKFASTKIYVWVWVCKPSQNEKALKEIW
jgi:hypothetical protein